MLRPDPLSKYERWVCTQLLDRKHLSISWDNGKVVLTGDGIKRQREGVFMVNASPTRTFPSPERIRKTLYLFGFRFKGAPLQTGDRKYLYQTVNYGSKVAGELYIWE